MFKAKTLMFDLDGTLVDSVPDIAWSVDQMCEDLNLPPRGIERVRNWIGNGTRVLVRRAIADSIDPCDESDLVDKGLARFEEHHAEHCCVGSKLYPTVFPTLQTLSCQGFKLVLITNKLSHLTAITLDHFGLTPFFDLVYGFDALPKAKPDPLPLLTAMKELGEPGVFIGDSATDIAAAKAAHVPVIAMTYGYNHGVSVTTLEPDKACASLDEILELVELV